MVDEGSLSGTCPYCGVSGECVRLVDHPDADLVFLVPVRCAGCGCEFTVDTNDA